ncbi:hypothetical protein [Hymenobacter weizhouensis]|uniref:hypothetical protein n=1 Tax=Hymenobacter sp. YIM 151500-1 TaxID=2987689 RepID=UPI00222658F5|nr:hypothetical protein [Hymenobacter sp. YIM 151500-1]UYZ62408.1 hypothetical protein OIS53_15580 [Hymenobacter sp. YIM 151500-1]
MRKLGWAIGGLLALVACSEPAAPAAGSNPRPLRQAGYFPMLRFLEQQAALLNRQRPAVQKQVSLFNGQQETTRLTPPDWTKELQIFQQADINKPALRGQYTVDSAATAEGLVRRTYRRQPTTDHPVQELTVLLQGSAVRELTATLRQDNPLVYSEKHFTLRCQPAGRLREYAVRGVQKLVLFDSVRYNVRTQVE